MPRTGGVRCAREDQLEKSRLHEVSREPFQAQQELGDIVYVDLPKIGARVKSGRSFGSVESVRAVSDIYAPVPGEVTAINETLASAPEKLNQDPHGAAWLIQVRVDKAADVANLWSAADYQKYVGVEI